MIEKADECPHCGFLLGQREYDMQVCELCDTGPDFQLRTPERKPKMTDPIALQPKPTWLASFDLVRTPSGQLQLVLSDARKTLIEAEPTASGEKLAQIADMAQEGLERMRVDAHNLMVGKT